MNFARNLFQIRIPGASAARTAAVVEQSTPSSAVAPAADPMEPGPDEQLLFFRVKKALFSRGAFHLLLGRATGESRKDPAFADQDEFVVAGVFETSPEEGLDYRIVGRFQTYKGKRSFRSRVAIELMPRGAKGIASWLRRQDFPGLGQTRITRIAKAAAARGEDALADVAFLEEQGLKTPLAERVAATWLVSGAEAKVKALLYAFGVRGATAKLLWQTKGAALLEILDQRPWALCTDGFVGFTVCDRIAVSKGLSFEHPERARAAVLEALRLASLEGHTALPRDALLLQAARVADRHPDDLSRALQGLLDDRLLVEPVEGLLQVRLRFHQEQTLAEALASPARRSVFESEDEAAQALAAAEERLGVRLDREGGQFAAAIAALTSRLAVISGGPGTGKTTTQRVIVEAMRANNAVPLLLSPTGRAAKRLGEATGAQAHTIAKIDHHFPNGVVKVHDANVDEPREPDAAIVDEASMLCLDGACRLVRFLPQTSPIVFVGDIDQLPSVGAGAVLRDLIDSGFCQVRWLDRIHRQATGNDIPQAARAVLAREVPGSGRDLLLRHCPDGRLQGMVQDAVRDLIDTHGFRPDEVQVLVPMKKGPLGSYALNAVLRPLLNQSYAGRQEELRSIGGFQFCLHDRVMNTKNDYARGVMNGEIGVLAEFVEQDDDTQIVVNFDGNIVTYSAKQDDVEDSFPLMPCYATTVHKAQGSEFPAVVVVTPSAHSRMLGRNLVYTALTRAKSRCVIVGDESSLGYGLRHVDVAPRVTNLVRHLAELRESATSIHLAHFPL